MSRRQGSSTTRTGRKQPLTSTGKEKAKRKASENLKEEVKKRRSTRVAKRYKNDAKPILSFASSYIGVSTQKLNDTQNIHFKQTATLSMTNDAPYDIAAYYEFRQEVRDGYTDQLGTAQPVGANFVQDGPYRPNYADAQITVTHGQIEFKDEPGFSTDRRVAAGQWLTSYDVYFRWTVTARYGTGATWTSPEVHHTVTSPYNGGADAAVTAAAAGNYQWVVQLPDRED